MNKKAIMYLLAEFPSQTETFILKEALFVNESIPLYILVLKKGKNQIDTRVFENRIIYIPPWWSWKILLHGLLNLNILYKNSTFTDFINSLHRIKIRLIASFISSKIKKLPIQHIHAHFANYPADIAMQVSHFLKIPFSFTAHANDIFVNSYNLSEKIRKAVFITTCTAYNKKWLDAKLTPEEQDKVYLIYHGVNMNYWRFRRPELIGNPVRILTIGRLIEKKGIIYLLQSICYLLDKGISVKLHIIGKGTEESFLKSFCKKIGIEHAVVFMGWQTPDQIKDLYIHSDVFVLPSVVAINGDRDGIPNVVLEAMSIGVPVISTTVSGIPEVIQNGYSGLLVAERDSEQLTNAIVSLINDMQLRKYLIKNAYQTIREKFDSNQYNQLLVKLFIKTLPSPYQVRTKSHSGRV